MPQPHGQKSNLTITVMLMRMAKTSNPAVMARGALVLTCFSDISVGKDFIEQIAK
jgi:hypothetical protein